jgi:hypothetical protein
LIETFPALLTNRHQEHKYVLTLAQLLVLDMQDGCSLRVLSRFNFGVISSLAVNSVELALFIMRDNRPERLRHF